MGAGGALLDNVVSWFDHPRRTDRGAMVRCPAHEDKRQSLHVSQGDDGRVLLKCHAGCDTTDVLARVGKTLADLFPPRERDHPKTAPPVLIAYDYRDEHGDLLYQAVRKQYPDRKDFFQRRPAPGGGWINNLKDVPRVLYRRPELLAADPNEVVLILEGEKDCDRAARDGWTATTNVGGAGKWRDDYSADLAGRHVVLFPDNDQPGYAHMLQVARSLEGAAASVTVVRLTAVPEKGDLSDALDAGLTWAALDPLVTGQRSKILGAELIDVDTLAELAGEPPAKMAGTDPKALLGKITGKVSATEPPAPGAGDDAPNPTDLGNARRLVAAHGAELRYCHPWGKWFAWDGRRWRLDESGEVVRRAKATIRDLYREAADLDDAARQALGKHALRSEAGARLRAMVDLTESEPGIPVHPDELDRDPWLLNVRNGTVNLRTGALRPHERGDLVTKLAAVEYDPAADCPTFLAFLDRIMAGNEGLIRFLQRAAGYSLTGDTSERVLMILHGEGRNGKSTFLEVLRSILGDYAIRTPTDTLMAKRENGIPNDVAALRGARFVSASEADEGRRLAEATIKDLTGGDTISARFMRGEFFNFAPEFKLWLGTNHKPGIRGTDQAIWDRIRLVPFTVRIPDSEQDKRLREKLLAEASGILTWALEGCLDWQRDGLGEPQEVTEATAGYRAEMDVLGAFLDDRCVCHEHAQVSAKALYAAYQAWCDETGEKPLTQQATGRRLTERGFDSAQLGKSRTRTWLGIGLKTDDDPPQGDERVNGFEGVNGSERLFRHNQNDSKSHEVISEKAFTSVHPTKAFTLDGTAEPAPLWELALADNDPEDDPWRR